MQSSLEAHSRRNEIIKASETEEELIIASNENLLSREDYENNCKQEIEESDSDELYDKFLNINNEETVNDSNDLDSSSTSCKNSDIILWYKFKRKSKIKIYKFLKKLKYHLIMCLKCLISTFIVLTSLQMSFPHSTHHVVPKKFFPPHSLVNDYYTGDLHMLAERLVFSELSFVMYYAPWDRECQVTRQQFSTTAKIMQEQIVFAAINCWQPDSSCRLNHKVSSYPALVLHVNTGAPKEGRGSIGGIIRESRAIPYNGPLTSQHFVRFLSKALQPYTHISNRKVLTAIQLTHTAVVLVFIPANLGQDYERLQSQLFTSLYKTSIHWLEYDKRSEVTWGVITDVNMAKELGLLHGDSSGEQLRAAAGRISLVLTDSMHTFNETLQVVSTPRPVLEWISKHMRASRSPSWVEVTSGKSALLHDMIHQGPTLLVFSSDHPYEQHNSLYDVSNGLWLEYSWCENISNNANNQLYRDSRRAKTSSVLLDSGRRQAALQAILRADCKSKPRHSTFTAEDLQDYDDTFPLIRENDDESSCCDESNIKHDCSHGYFTCHRFMPFFAKSGGIGELVWSLVDGACHTLFGYNLPADNYNSLCQSTCLGNKCSFDNTSNVNKTKTGSPQVNRLLGAISIKDEKISEALSWYEDEQCRQLENIVVETQNDVKHNKHNITGMGCASSNNRSLSFGVLDMAQHYDIAQRWGLNKLSGLSSGAVIIDIEQEIHYVLPGPISSHSLAQFIYNHSMEVLNRKLLSKIAPSLYSADYRKELINDDISNKVYSSMSKKSPAINNVRKDSSISKDSHLMVRELTASDYLNVTQSPGQSALVLHYSRSCVHCTAASHTLLAVSSYFSASPELSSLSHSLPIVFARIDMAANTLPWNVNFASIPTFIFYPPFQKSNSRVFDSRLPLTVNNILRFIAASLSAPIRLRLALEGCAADCIDAVRSILPSRTASITRRLMLATSRLHRVSHALLKAKSAPSKAPQFNNDLIWTHHVQKRLMKESIKSLRKEHKYLLKLQDWFKDNSTSYQNNDLLYSLSSLRKILNSFIHVNDL